MVSEQNKYILDLLFNVSTNSIGWSDWLNGIVNIASISQASLHIFSNGDLDARFSFSSVVNGLRQAPRAEPPCRKVPSQMNDDRSRHSEETFPVPSSCPQMCGGFSRTGKLINDHQYLICLQGDELDRNILDLSDDMYVCIEKALNHWLEDQYRKDLIQHLFKVSENSDYGICYMGQDGKVLYQNAAMRDLSERQDGLRIIRDEFYFDDQEIANQFRSLCKHVATLDADPFIKIERPSGRKNYLLELHKVRGSQSAGYEQALFVLTVKDLDVKATISTTLLIRLFGLTRTESVVAHQLFLNKSEQEIAEDLNNSLNTIKTHRKRIYSKLNVRSRGEFVSLVVLIVK